MQKVVTVLVYTGHPELEWAKGQTFIDHKELNELLAEGWIIQSQFTTTTPASTTLVAVTFILAQK